ncbi:MAG: UvrB/UvrC motif-containing protein [Syntrophomonadaceae bacterium]|jgi:protein arginine kinase activator
MNCENCQQRPATVHFTQMINGSKVEMHLCQECAAKKGAFVFDLDNKFSISNLLGSFFGTNLLQGTKTISPEMICSNCGMSLAGIRQTGKLGCSECYISFEGELEPSLRRIHGNSRHIGKIPSRGGSEVLLKRQLDNLKAQLQQAVAAENYEKAAEIRDKIKELEKKAN